MLARFIAILLLLTTIVIVSGCATTESDMPWAERASWEGTPYIPGFSE